MALEHARGTRDPLVALAWEFVQQDRFWPWRGGGETSAAGALAPRVAYCLQVRAQKEEEVRRWLTETGNGRGRDTNVPAARSGGGVQAELRRCSSRRQCGRAPSLLIRPIDPCGSCGGAEGVRKVQGSPASRNRTADRELTGVGPERFWQLQGMGIGIGASGGSLVSSRNRTVAGGGWNAVGRRVGGYARSRRGGDTRRWWN